jgi:sigma-E factor negative regulatory protein RseA
MSLHTASPEEFDPALGRRSRLSAAMDGEREPLDQACRAWRDDADARATWHAYHLIGDVMRSGELATAPPRDAAFLAALRERLAVEPVVLAPAQVAPAAVPARARSAWLVPAAAAAGFVVVAGVLVVSRLSGPAADGGAPVLAGASGPSAGVLRVSNVAPAAPLTVVTGAVIRDPRLDEYLRAHQAARGGFVATVPGSSLRQVDAQLAGASPR